MHRFDLEEEHQIQQEHGHLQSPTLDDCVITDGFGEGEAREDTGLRGILLCRHLSLDTAQASAPRECEAENSLEQHQSEKVSDGGASWCQLTHPPPRIKSPTTTGKALHAISTYSRFRLLAPGLDPVCGP